MTISRPFVRTACMAAGLLAICCGSLPAQDAAGNRGPGEDGAINLKVSAPAGDIGEVLRYIAAAGDADDVLPLTIATYRNTLGVEIGDIDPALRTQLDLGAGVGIIITAVNVESEAAKAGLQKYDIVLKVDDQPVARQQQFNDWFGKQTGKPMQVHIVRQGKPMTIAITVPDTPVYRYKVAVADAIRGHLAQRVAIRWRANAEPAVESHYRIGITLAEADDVLRSQLKLASGEGLVVTDVVPDSPAAKIGIQKNDVLVKLDGKRLMTVEAINTQVQEIKDRKVALALVRAGAEISLDVAPQLTSHSTAGYQMWQTLRDSSRVQLWETPTVAEAILLNEAERRVSASAAEQISALKKQLADLQKAVESLEASLRAGSPEKVTPQPEEKK